MPRVSASQLGHLKDDQSDADVNSPRKISKLTENSLPEQTVARSITEELPSSSHHEPEPPQASPKPKSPGFADSRMDDAILDRLSTLLRSGCSIQMACNEVLAAALPCSIPQPKHCSIQAGLARTTFYRWVDRIRRMQSDPLLWPGLSQSYHMFAEAIAFCNIKKVAEGSGSIWSSPVNLRALAEDAASHLEPSITTNSPHPSSDASTLPGLTYSSFAVLPKRLRQHFLHMMHNAVKTNYGRHKAWTSMSSEEKTTLQELSEEVLKYPTKIGEPLQFIWDGALVTKHFTTYEFLRPICLQLMIRYLRDRCYRAVKPNRHATNDGISKSAQNHGSAAVVQDDDSSDPNDSFASDSETSKNFQFDEESGFEFTSVTGSNRVEMNEHDLYFQHTDVDRLGHLNASDFDARCLPTREEPRNTSPAELLAFSTAGQVEYGTSEHASSIEVQDLALDFEKECNCHEQVAEVRDLPLMEGLLEFSGSISGNVMVVHHGRGNSVQWLLSHTAASSICALDWCPIVNASIYNLTLSSVAVTVPGHVLLPEELGDYCAYNAIIDTNVSVFCLHYPPLFPERDRELPELKKHLSSISKLLATDGTAFLMCRSTDALSTVVSIAQSLSLEIIRIIRCFGSSLLASLKTEEVWVVARKR